MTTLAPRPTREFSLPRWVGLVTAGESLGFLIPMAGLAVVTVTNVPSLTGWLLVAMCGGGEGAMLGLAQSQALRDSRFRVPRTPWVAVTAVAATVAWSIGMLPTTLVGLGLDIDLTNPLIWLMAVVGGMVLLASIPAAQYPLLTRVLPRAWRWIPLNMAAWLIGLLFTFLPGPFVDEGTPAWVMTAAFIAAGICMAATVATIVGVGLARMTRTQARAPRG